MRLAGTARIAAPRAQVWAALRDPDVLARVLPGCRAIERVAPATYAVALEAGMASTRGTYRGHVEVVDRDEPGSLRLRVEGAGEPGTVRADALVTLGEEGGATLLSYEVDAVVGGGLAAVGQRMLTGIAARTADDALGSLERELAGVPNSAGEEVPPAEERQTPVAPVAPVAPGARPEPAPAVEGRAGLLRRAATGAGLVVAGVLLGRWSRRGR